MIINDIVIRINKKNIFRLNEEKQQQQFLVFCKIITLIVLLLNLYVSAQFHEELKSINSNEHFFFE